MKIILVGNIYGNDLGANYYMIMQKLLHGFARNGHVVHVFNDREAARAATPFRSRKLGLKAANRLLLETCQKFRPDIVFLGHSEMIWNETILNIRDVVPDVKIAYRNVDPLFDEDNRKRIFNRVRSADVIFVTTAGSALEDFATADGAKIRFMPNPVDPSVEVLRQFKTPGSELPIDLFFGISGLIKGGDVRKEMVDDLRGRLMNVNFQVSGLDFPAVRGAEYFDVLSACKMGLNFSRANNYYLYSSDRMAQYLGCGLLTFVDKAAGFGDIFSADELIFYESRENLAEQIEFFAKDDEARRRVAQNGWARAHAVFDTSRIAKYLVESIVESAFSEDYEWPTHAAKMRT